LIKGKKDQMKKDAYFLKRAIDLARKGMNANEGGPFGAIVVKGEKIIGEGWNRVVATNDPTAHAEIMAIREACRYLYDFQLEDCTIYTSCEPCPMCLGAIYWARPKRVVFACTKEDAAAIEFDDQFIYEELELSRSERKLVFEQMNHQEGLELFQEWESKENKKMY
jgi:tRNA(Arg) A34 adenosine deaminase TadA